MAGLYSKFLDFIGIEESDEPEDQGYYDQDERYNNNDRSYGRDYGRDNDRTRDRDRDRDNDRTRDRDRDNPVTFSGREKPSKNVKSTANAQSGIGNLPINGGQKMIVYHPVSYEDTQSIIDNLRNRKPVIVNMEELEVDTAQRILDFLSGAVYALDGTMCKISRNIFVVAPLNYDVVGNGDDEEWDM